MNEPTLQSIRRGLTVSEWVAIGSLLLSVCTIVFVAGFVWGQVQSNTGAIKDLQASKAESIDRLARIETKLDIVLVDHRR